MRSLPFSRPVASSPPGVVPILLSLLLLGGCQGAEKPPAPVVVPVVVSPVLSGSAVKPGQVAVAAPVAAGGAATPTMVTAISPVTVSVAAAAVGTSLPVAVAPQLPPQPQAADPAAQARGTYVVKQGGRLATVAKRTGTHVDALIRLNPGLRSDVVLPAGTRVLLPVPWSD